MQVSSFDLPRVSPRGSNGRLTYDQDIDEDSDNQNNNRQDDRSFGEPFFPGFLPASSGSSICSNIWPFPSSEKTIQYKTE